MSVHRESSIGFMIKIIVRCFFHRHAYVLWDKNYLMGKAFRFDRIVYAQERMLLAHFLAQHV